MNKYKDVFESTNTFTEAKADSDFLGTLVFSWGRSDVFNKNHRYYPHKVFTSAVESLNTRIGKGNIPGQIDHPLGSGGTRLADVSHILTKVWMDKNKVAWAEAKFLKTQKAKDALQIIKSDVKIGASLRGFGEIDKDGKVRPGLEVKTVDLVVDPSFGVDATITQSSVIESFVFEEEEYQFDEDDLKEITSAMDTLNDETIKLVQEKLEKDENIVMTAEKVKALSLWIRMSKDNPNIAPFNKWFAEQQKLFVKNDPNFQEEINSELRHKASLRAEKRLAESPYSANTMFESRKRIEARQKEIDEALDKSRYDAKTISRLFSEYCLAGGHLSRADWIREFGF